MEKAGLFYPFKGKCLVNTRILSVFTLVFRKAFYSLQLRKDGWTLLFNEQYSLTYTAN